MATTRSIDWAAEGLLDGLDGSEREARRELLDDLVREGLELAEIRRAAEEGRLALLLVDHALAGPPKYSGTDAAAKTGLPVEYLLRIRKASGLAAPGPDDVVYDEDDLEILEITARFREAGFDEEALFDVTRVLGRGMAQAAEAIRSLVERTFTQETELSEREIAHRTAHAAQELLPLTGPLLQNLLRLHLRDQVRQQVVADLIDAGSGTRPVAVVFADLVGYTKLGQYLDDDQMGQIAHRLEILATEIVDPPVRLVKTIGDAVMLVAPEPAPLLNAAFDLLDRIEQETEDFPQLHVGAAYGRALARSGDWYGEPVNLASRITTIARPGSVLVDDRVREQCADSFEFSFAGERSLRGISGRQRLFRARRIEEGSRPDD